MEKQVLNTVRKYKLIEEGDAVIVGLSGGADSVSLLVSLNSIKNLLKIKKLIAVHINHNLRATAKRDEEFSKALCEKLGIEFYSKSIDIKALKEELKICEEEAGRIARYRFFNEIKEKTRANKIATAHNKNDQAETFLLRLLRGGGSDGLSSIKPLREDGVIRPLIETSREDIEKYLKEKGQDFVTDETNLKPDYLRNKIRLELIPYLKENFNFKEDLVVKTSDSLREDSEFIKSEAIKYFNKAKKGNDFIEFSVSELSELPPALLKRVITLANEYMGGKGLLKDTLTLTQKIIKASETGKSVSLSKNLTAEIQYGKFIIKKHTMSQPYSYMIKLGENYIKELNATFILTEILENSKDSINIPFFSSLIVRTRKAGDRMYIKNTGHKKVNDIFSDRKIKKDKRDIFPVVSLDDEIVWLPGMYKKEFDNSEYNLKIKWEK